MKIKTKLLVLMVLIISIISLSMVSAEIKLDDSFPFFYTVDNVKMDALPDIYDHLIAEDVYNREGTLLPKSDVEPFLNAIYYTDSATDVGLDKTKDIQMDWVTRGTSRCLGVNVTDTNYFADGTGTFVIKDLNIDAKTISSPSIYRIVTTNEIDKVSQTDCSKTTEVKTANGSIQKSQVCTDGFVENEIVTRQEIPVDVIDSFITERARSDTFAVDGVGYYESCFTIPFESLGTVYFEYGDQAYVDKQHSSWWNNSYTYQKQINITNTDSVLQVRRFYTINVSVDTSTLIAAGKMQKDCHDLRVVCGQTEMDRVFFNDTGVRWEFQGSGCGSTDTQVLFRMDYNITAGTTDTNCSIYYGNAAADKPLQNISNIFVFAENWSRGDSTTLGNGWNESTAGITINTKRAIWDVNNGVAWHPFDTGILNDANGFTIYNAQMWGGTAGSGSRLVLNNVSGGTIYSNINMFMVNADTSAGVVDTNDATGYKKIAGAPTSGRMNNYTMFLWQNGTEFDAYGTTNGVYINWDTSNGTLLTRQKIGYVNIFANRVADGMGSIFIRRFMYHEPTMKLGSETNNTGLPHSSPTQGSPIINMTTQYNQSRNNLSIFNTSTAQADGLPVKNIYVWFRNNGTANRDPFTSYDLTFEGGSNGTYTRGYVSSLSGNNESFADVYGATWNSSKGYDGWGAYSCDGVNDYLRVRNTNTNIVSTENFSINLKFKRVGVGNATGTSNRDYIIAKGLGNSDGWGIGVRDDNNSIFFAQKNPAGNMGLYGLKWAITDGIWYDLTIVKFGSNITFYVDGIVNRSFVTGTMTDIARNVSFCAGLDPSAIPVGFFNGTIDTITIYNASLTTQEVQMIHDNLTNKVHSSMISAGQNWVGCIVPNDKVADGAPACAGLNVNNPPVINSYLVNSTSRYNYTNGSVQFNYTATDADSDTMTLVTSWYINNVLNKTWDNSTGGVAADNKGGDNFTVYAYVWDTNNEKSGNVSGTVILNNTAPMFTWYLLNTTSTKNYTNGSVQFNYTAVDLQGGAITLVTSWYTNNVMNKTWDNRTGATGKETKAGDNFTVYAYLTDNSNNSANVSATVIIQNMLPTITITQFNTSSPDNHTNSTIRLQILVNDYDSNESQTLTNISTYYIDGTMNKTFDNYSIPNIVWYGVPEENPNRPNVTNMARPNENWTIVVSTWDGFARGNATGSILFTNSLPYLDSINITFSLSSNKTDSNLTGHYTFKDSDNDPFIDQRTKWYRNGVRNTSWDNLTEIDKSATEPMDTFIFSAEVNDGYGWSGFANSSAVTIVNDVPTVPLILPQYYIETYNESIDLSCYNSTTIDTHNLNYEFWVGNATSWGARQNGTSMNYSFYFYDNDTLNFQCKANDEVNASAFSANTTLYYNNSIVFGQTFSYANPILSGQNDTFVFNISYNKVRVADVSAFIEFRGVNYTAAEINATGLANTSSFQTSLFVPFTAVTNNTIFYWHLNEVDWNGSLHHFRYNMTLTSLPFVAYTSGCNATSGNDTLWVVANITLRDEVNSTVQNGALEGTIWLYPNSQTIENNFSIHISNTSSADNFNQTFICVSAAGTGSMYYNTYAYFRYTILGDDPRSYFLIHERWDNTTQEIDMYGLPIELATPIQFHIKDENQQPLPNIYIMVQRYDPATATYRTIAMGRTDSFGEDTIFLRKDDVDYRFILYDDTNIVKITTKGKITTSDNIITLTVTSGDVFEYYNELNQVSNKYSTLTWDNSTDTVTSTFNIPEDFNLGQSCLIVWRKSLFNFTSKVCSECSTNQTGTMTCNIGNTTTGYLGAVYYLNNMPVNSITFERGTTPTFTKLLGKNGIYLTIIFAGTIAMAGIYSPVAAIVLFIFGMVIASAMQLLSINFVWILGIAILGGYIVYQLRS